MIMTERGSEASESDCETTEHSAHPSSPSCLRALSSSPSSPLESDVLSPAEAPPVLRRCTSKSCCISLSVRGSRCETRGARTKPSGTRGVGAMSAGRSAAGFVSTRETMRDKDITTQRRPHQVLIAVKSRCNLHLHRCCRVVHLLRHVRRELLHLVCEPQPEAPVRGTRDTNCFLSAAAGDTAAPRQVAAKKQRGRACTRLPPPAPPPPPSPPVASLGTLAPLARPDCTPLGCLESAALGRGALGALRSAAD